MCRVSVVIPSYNHARFIREAIESVAAQTYRDFELVVVDDGSSDDSPRIIREVLEEAKIERASFIEQNNAGTARAIERGVAAAEGQIIAILNSDDRFAPQRIAQMLEESPTQGEFLSFSKARMVDAAGIEYPAESEHVIGYRHGLYEASRCPTVGFALLRNNIAVSSGNLVFSRSLYDKLGGFAPFALASDWDFLLRALLHVEPVFVSDALFDYRTHGSNARLEFSGTEANREGSEILNRYFDAADHEPPANLLAPCERHWPVYFDLFVSRYHAWFGSGPIREWMDHPPRPISSETSLSRWRSWSEVVEFERVDDCDYLLEDELDAQSRVALALAREVLISEAHPLASEEGPAEDALREVFERHRPGQPRVVRHDFETLVDRSFAPTRRGRSIVQRVLTKVARAVENTARAISPRRWAQILWETRAIAKAGLFDTEYYEVQTAGSTQRGAWSLWHYVRHGATDGLNPHPLFDSAFYLRTNPDVAASKENPFAHYLLTGGFEGRSACALFDSAFYLASNPDVVERHWSPLVHYVRHGAAEGRRPHLRFDPDFYRNEYEDELPRGADPLAHYLSEGRTRGLAMNARQRMRLCFEATEGSSPLPVTSPRDKLLMRTIRSSGFFEDDFYRSACGSDFDTSQTNHPLRHFVQLGSIEGVPFCSGESLERKLREIDLADESRPELSYLQDRPKPSPEGRSVAIYVSSVGNSFFREIAMLLAHTFRSAGAQAELFDERADASPKADSHIVVAAHEFFLLGEGPKRINREFLGRCSLWLAEQPGSEFFAICLWFARFSRSVLDINPLTALLWGRMGIRSRAFPLAYCEGFDPYEDRRSLDSPLVRAGQTREVRDYSGSIDDPWSDRPLDIFYNAVLTERRDRFIAGNAELFSNLRCALFLPSPQRPLSDSVPSALSASDATALSQRAKIQLNIHRGELPYFEWHRLVVRGIWQKSVVVTEPCFRVPGLIPGKHYLECELEDIPRTVDWLLRTSAGRAEAEAIRKRAFETLVEAYPAKRIAAAFLAEDATWTG